MEVWSSYHRRSLVEPKMHCIKRLGERVMSQEVLQKLDAGELGLATLVGEKLGGTFKPPQFSGTMLAFAS